MKSLATAVFMAFAFAGVAVAQDYVPPPPVSLTVVVGKSTAVAAWAAPGDPCNYATCAEYDLRYSTSTITECNFAAATRASVAAPSSPGNAECFDLTGLACGTTYYFAVKTRDSAGNWSVISNVVSRTPMCNVTVEVTCQ